MSGTWSVYVLQHPADVVKIGVSEAPAARCETISAEMSVPLSLVWAAPPHASGKRIEPLCHSLLRDKLASGFSLYPSEWFTVSAEEARLTVECAIELWDQHGPRSYDVASGRLLAHRGWLYTWARSNVSPSKLAKGALIW